MKGKHWRKTTVMPRSKQTNKVIIIIIIIIMKIIHSHFYLFKCLHNSLKANYKIGTTEDGITRTHKQRQTQRK
jgi:uncharacterized protein YpmB